MCELEYVAVKGENKKREGKTYDQARLGMRSNSPAESPPECILRDEDHVCYHPGPCHIEFDGCSLREKNVGRCSLSGSTRCSLLDPSRVPHVVNVAWPIALEPMDVRRRFG